MAGAITMRYVPNVPGINAAATAAGTVGVKLVTDMTVDIARDTAPVLTGTYRESIKQRVLGLEGVVFSDIRYAPYLEFGTSDTPTFATLRRASEAAKI